MNRRNPQKLLNFWNTYSITCVKFYTGGHHNLLPIKANNCWLVRVSYLVYWGGRGGIFKRWWGKKSGFYVN